MANAKQCDICGKFYMPYCDENASVAKNPNCVRLSNVDYKGSCCCTHHYDCCSECMLSLRDHIEFLRKEERAGKK